MHVFYTPDIQTHAELPEEEAQHVPGSYGCKQETKLCLQTERAFYNAEITLQPTNVAW